MVSRSFKSLLVVAFSLVGLFFSNMSWAQPGSAAREEAAEKEAPKLNPSKIIFEHISDSHEFHFFTFNKKPVAIPLPVILYSARKGWSVFMFSKFDHGREVVDGYRLIDEAYAEAQKLDPNVFKAGKIYATGTDGAPDSSVKVYDLSLGRNVVQMLISVVLLIWIMGGVAKKYAGGQGAQDRLIYRHDL